MGPYSPSSNNPKDRVVLLVTENKADMEYGKTKQAAPVKTE